MSTRHMNLVAYLKTGPTGNHVGAWRHPDSVIDDVLEPSRYENIARILEAAKFDGCFFADLFGLYDIHGGNFDIYLERGGQVSYLDPMMVLPMMARVTTRLGLGATLSTTFNNPYHLARMLGSLDVLSGGRVAWNVVTSATDLEARNFGIDRIPPKEQRYDRADEVLEACCALWDGWQPGAFVLDKAAGRWADASKVRYANYEGRHVRTRGPLSIPRSPQGRPVLMQAGASDRGRDFAARWAEAIFTAQPNKPQMQAFHADMKARVAAQGRAPEGCRILQQLTLVLGETRSIAEEKAAYLASLIDPELALAANSSGLAVDLSKVDPGHMKAAQGDQGIQGTADRIQQIMAADQVPFQEAARRSVRNLVAGTVASVADHMQDLFEDGCCDGFVVSPTVFPQIFEQVGAGLVPELQRRGLFRREYTGRTLRENLLGAPCA